MPTAPRCQPPGNELLTSTLKRWWASSCCRTPPRTCWSSAWRSGCRPTASWGRPCFGPSRSRSLRRRCAGTGCPRAKPGRGSPSSGCVSVRTAPTAPPSSTPGWCPSTRAAGRHCCCWCRCTGSTWSPGRPARTSWCGLPARGAWWRAGRAATGAAYPGPQGLRSSGQL